MEDETLVIRPATKDDAADLVRFVSWAGEGMPELIWADMADPGQSVEDVGLARAARDEGGFSFTNAVLLDAGQAPLAAIIGYDLPDTPVEIGPDFPAAFVPLQELENLAPGYWYVNVLAVLPEHRGKGLGSRLMADAERRAKAAGRPGMAIIAFASNPGAVRLYQRLGYVETARRQVHLEGWAPSGTDAVLLLKRF